MIPLRDPFPQRHLRAVRTTSRPPLGQLLPRSHADTHKASDTNSTTLVTLPPNVFPPLLNYFPDVMRLESFVYPLPLQLDRPRVKKEKSLPYEWHLVFSRNGARPSPNSIHGELPTPTTRPTLVRSSALISQHWPCGHAARTGAFLCQGLSNTPLAPSSMTSKPQTPTMPCLGPPSPPSRLQSHKKKV